MDAYCYNLTIQSNIAKHAGSVSVRTNKPIDLQNYTLAEQIMRRTYVHLANDRSAAVKGITPITSFGAMNALQNELSIARPFGRDDEERFVYIMPVGSTRVTLVLKGPENESSDETYMLFAPSNIVAIDCTGQATLDLLKQIAGEYMSRCPGGYKINTWQDIVKIPIWFTEPFGVRIESSESLVTISVNKTDAVLPQPCDNSKKTRYTT